MRSIRLVALGLIGLLSACGWGGGDGTAAPRTLSDAAVLHESHFAADSTLSAQPHQTVVLELESDTAHENDTGEAGHDRIPYRVSTAGSFGFCIEDDDGEPHALRLLDGDGTVLGQWGHGEPCDPVQLAAGDYFLEAHHGAKGSSDLSPDRLFIRPGNVTRTTGGTGRAAPRAAPDEVLNPGTTLTWNPVSSLVELDYPAGMSQESWAIGVEQGGYLFTSYQMWPVMPAVGGYDFRLDVQHVDAAEKRLDAVIGLGPNGADGDPEYYFGVRTIDWLSSFMLPFAATDEHYDKWRVGAWSLYPMDAWDAPHNFLLGWYDSGSARWEGDQWTYDYPYQTSVPYLPTQVWYEPFTQKMVDTPIGRMPDTTLLNTGVLVSYPWDPTQKDLSPIFPLYLPPEGLLEFSNPAVLEVAVRYGALEGTGSSGQFPLDLLPREVVLFDACHAADSGFPDGTRYWIVHDDVADLNDVLHPFPDVQIHSVFVPGTVRARLFAQPSFQAPVDGLVDGYISPVGLAANENAEHTDYGLLLSCVDLNALNEGFRGSLGVEENTNTITLDHSQHQIVANSNACIGCDLRGFDGSATSGNGHFRGGDFSFSDLRGADLSGADFTGATLTGVDFSAADLSSATLASTDLSSTTLSGANLSNATLTNVTAVGTNFENCTVAGATLSGDFFGAKFRSADLSSLNMDGGRLEGADFRRADLSNASLVGAHLCGALLNPATLVGTDLASAILTHEAENTRCVPNQAANLSGSNMENAKLNDAQLGDVKLDGVSWHGQDATGANAILTGATFNLADLPGLNLQDAKLDRAILTNASLINTDLSGASLADATLDTANLKGAKLGDASLNGASLQNAAISTTGGTTYIEVLRTIDEYKFFAQSYAATTLPSQMNGTTTCPDGSWGPCSDDKWTSQQEAQEPTNCQPKAGSPDEFVCTSQRHRR